MSRVLDLNADVGEGVGNEAALLPLISSANVCCGFHAGGVAEAVRTIQEASRRGIVIGAHPGFADREHSGRRELAVTPDDVRYLTAYQLGALQALAEALGCSLRYVKPHGALYHQLCRNRSLAEAFVAVVERWHWPVVGLPDSQLEWACRGRVPFVREGFADRRYRPDGTLVPRTEPHALLHDPQEAFGQAQRLIQQSNIRTLCIHGDTPGAVDLARQLRNLLQTHGYVIESFVANMSPPTATETGTTELS
ncbi:MAG: LamB/YcsF family protein [Gemmataceae bacterium]|nr:LamB/YcsF family protein [Gemmataceae bacterium]MCS7270497.1 LamB/YcsF family protein [Gemmataceae bacterium]MDW8242248.1 5-oxoprolinase subunit PxpA [Thermogemmata sp.]